MNDERYQSERLNEDCAEAERKFRTALDELRSMAYDFSEGSQQRWMLKLREVSAARDNYWYIQHRDEQPNP